MDNISSKERSILMAKVKSKNNRSTELRVIEIFKQFNIKGWKRNYPIKGKPDFVFLNKKIAVFVDGCFWHDCPKHCRIPETNREYWIEKIQMNKERDIRINQILTKRGWTVIRIWEHDLKKRTLNENIFRRVFSIVNAVEA